MTPHRPLSTKGQWEAVSVGLVLQDAIPTSLLRLGAENSVRAVKMFGGVQKFMGTSGGGVSSDGPTDASRFEVAAKLLQQAIKRAELRDELYMQAWHSAVLLHAKIQECSLCIAPCKKLDT